MMVDDVMHACIQIIAIHAFTQESQPHDAVQKLEDLDGAIRIKEPQSAEIAVAAAALFSGICARQPRALQICARLLERVVKSSSLDSTASSDGRATVHCQLGHVYVLQGPGFYEKAMKAFREATRANPENAKALEGMILCHICEGSIEDAEAQVELLTLMHSAEDLGHEFAYLQSLMLKQKKGGKKAHLQSLIDCHALFLQRKGRSSTSYLEGPFRPYLNAFQDLLYHNPDQLMLLAMDFFRHMEVNTSISSCLPGTANTLLNAGGSSKDAGPDTAAPEAPSGPSSSSLLHAEVEISQAVKIGLELIQEVGSIVETLPLPVVLSGAVFPPFLSLSCAPSPTTHPPCHRRPTYNYCRCCGPVLAWFARTWSCPAATPRWGCSKRRPECCTSASPSSRIALLY